MWWMEQEELDRMREEEQQRKLQELNKQRELFYTAELERERRRQHTAVIKALESRKRYEERERKREEIRAEKRAEREKKLEDRRKVPIYHCVRCLLCLFCFFSVSFRHYVYLAINWIFIGMMPCFHARHCRHSRTS